MSRFIHPLLCCGLMLGCAALLSACGGGAGGAGGGVKTAKSPKDIGGIFGLEIGSSEASLNLSGWTKDPDPRKAGSYKKPGPLKIGAKSYPCEMSLYCDNGKLLMGSLSFPPGKLSDTEAKQVYDALYNGLHKEYDASMFGGGLLGDVKDLGGSGITQIKDSEGDVLQLIKTSGMINLTVQSHER